MRIRTSVLPYFEERRQGARRIAFRCGTEVRLLALRLPSFLRGGVFGSIPWLGFGVVFGGVKQSSGAQRHRENGEAHVAKRHLAKDDRPWCGGNPDASAAFCGGGSRSIRATA
jgi:hypothetical protein